MSNDSAGVSKHSISGPRVFLHLDGVAVLAGSVAAYIFIGGRWWLFAALILAPDLFMLGYLAGQRTGAFVYNGGHLILMPLVFVAAGILAPSPLLIEVGVIWAGHIGMVHVFGYGFKYPTGFKETHFERV